MSRIIKRLYEDNVNGKISDERFMELSADYEQEQRELKDRTAALQAELDKSQAATVNAEKFMGIVRKHLAFEELTPTLLREMIEKIVVHECSYDENGTRRQDIEIYYSNGKIFCTSIASLSHISKISGHEAAHGGRRYCVGGRDADSASFRSVRVISYVYYRPTHRMDQGGHG